MEFNEQAFRQKFKQLDTNNQGRLQKDSISNLLRQFDLEQHRASIQNAVTNFYFYANRFQVAHSKLHNLKNTQINEQDEEQQEQQNKVELESYANDYKLNIDEALKYAYLVQRKMTFEIWKKTCVMLGIQQHLAYTIKRTIFPLKDPAQQGQASIIIGKQQESYNSSFKFSLKKVPSTSNQPVAIVIKISTNNEETSVKIGNSWRSIYQMITGILEQEMPDSKQFLKSIKITTEENNSHFLLRIQSINAQLNQFLKTFSDLGDIIFKTTLKLKLDVSLDFNFDIGEFISNKNSNLYEFLAQNIRIKIKFQGSQYITALKELMIANRAFSDLSYVNDDSFSLGLISLVNTQNFDLKLRFNNNFLGQQQQESLKAILGVLSQLKQIMVQYEESMPDVINLLKEILRFRMQAQVKAYDFTVNLALNIRNLDQLIFKRSVLLNEDGEQMENFDGNKEQTNSNENNSENE